MEKQMILEKEIDYQFRKPELLEEALTHRSYSHEKHTGKNYERLELLGDSVIQMVVTDSLLNRFPEMEEGELTQRRAGIVCEKSLAEKARALKLGKYARLGNGELSSGGADRDGLLCDLMEAVIGAVYRDGGFYKATEFIERFILNDNDIESRPFKDYKSRLQEWYGSKSDRLEYRVVSTTQNADNSMTFVVELWDIDRGENIVSHRKISQGIGNSKKEVEQQAAGIALRKFLVETKD